MDYEDEIEKAIIQMLGANAYDNSQQVEPDFGKVCHAVKYLVTQIQITKRWCDEPGKEHVDDVIKTTSEILNKTK